MGSTGAAVYPADGDSYEVLLAEADHRMYRDKAVRRGRIALPRASRPDDFVAPTEFEQSAPGLEPSLDRARTVA